eukprot:Lithocolla_globosa_v1_NODE_3478_length_1659_cov_17.500623.p4 type:complete len:114 gc:universal NODE_3478_length_1659_cov_17.500623:564-223(-)
MRVRASGRPWVTLRGVITQTISREIKTFKNTPSRARHTQTVKHTLNLAFSSLSLTFVLTIFSLFIFLLSPPSSSFPSFSSVWTSAPTPPSLSSPVSSVFSKGLFFCLLHFSVD